MSITFTNDLDTPGITKIEPCLCAQGSPVWGDFYDGQDTESNRQALKRDANPDCVFCKGEGIETVEHDLPGTSFNLANENAAILLNILGFKSSDNEDQLVGSMPLPLARRALIKAMSKTNLKEFERPREELYGRPREIEPGVVDMRPLRMLYQGVDETRIKKYINYFKELVEKTIKEGGTKIVWY